MPAAAAEAEAAEAAALSTVSLLMRCTTVIILASIERERDMCRVNTEQLIRQLVTQLVCQAGLQP